MGDRIKIISLLVLGLAVPVVAGAQEANPTTTNTLQPGQTTTSQMTQQGTHDNVPLYKVEVVGRDIPAINYFNRSGATKIGLQGTSLLPGAKGSAKVESRAGRTVVDLNMEGLSPANGFGNEYLTYVVWAITPEGRPVNIGEILPTGHKDRFEATVTTNLQAFGLVITAEPYFAVTMPSDLVVMQNFVLEDKTQGVIEQVNAHYSLLPRGAYAETAGRHTVVDPITRNEETPLEVYEAANAVNIADRAGAETYAADTMTAAKTDLQNAEDLSTHHGDRKQAVTYAREAVQSAEDARIIALRKLKADDDAAALKGKQDAEEQAAQAQDVAVQQAAQRAQAEEAAARARAEADQARAAAGQARSAQEIAEQSAQQARERLKDQLNQVLQTHETARGLIVNMSDVLFDFNKYTLKPEAREKLAKVSGILLAYPGLKLQVEGYTDNVGSDEYNQKLSEERAGSVRDYLVMQSVAETNVSAEGYGKSSPVADNSTASGRAENRRVQLVVSGAAIGVEQGAPGQQGDAASPVNGPGGSQSVTNPGGVANPAQQ